MNRELLFCLAESFNCGFTPLGSSSLVISRVYFLLFDEKNVATKKLRGGETCGTFHFVSLSYGNLHHSQKPTAYGSLCHLCGFVLIP